MPGFSKIAFTDAVRALQERYGSRASYARVEAREGDDVSLGTEEIDFIESRDSFYLGSVTSDGWPYVQHRGGPRGFLKAIDATHLAFADFGGNRQYISLGNLATNDRVSLFLMDYPTRTRFKVLARARVVDPADDAGLAAKLAPPDGYRGKVERIFVLEIAAWDWNCPQHITPRYTAEEIEAAMKEHD